MRILIVTSRLPPEPDNIGAYSYHLAQALKALGDTVTLCAVHGGGEGISDIPVLSLAALPGDFTRLRWLAGYARRHRGTVVLWQYNPFSYGSRGLPVVAPLLPLVLKFAGRCRVGVVFHELAVAYGRDPRRWVQALWERAVLWPILAGTDRAIVTAHYRQRQVVRYLRRCFPGKQRRLQPAVVPVGSNIPIRPATAPRPAGDIIRIGAFSSVDITAPLETLHHRLTDAGYLVCLYIIGASTKSPVDLSSLLQSGPGIVATGYRPAEEVSAILQALDLFVGPQGDGASGRRTSTAAAFAHGLSVVTTWGEEGAEPPFRHGVNCLLTNRGDMDELFNAIVSLIEQPDLRSRLAAAALETYRSHLAWEVIARSIHAELDR